METLRQQCVGCATGWPPRAACQPPPRQLWRLTHDAHTVAGAPCLVVRLVRAEDGTGG
jgi:hypothetical protein